MAVTPALVSSSSIGTKDKTISLNIDIGVAGQKTETAVFAADPTALTSNLKMLVWFHGHKSKDWAAANFNINGFDTFTGEQYLTVPVFKFREAILAITKKTFDWVLVVPTLGAKSQSGTLTTKSNNTFLDFLDQIVNGVKQHLGANVTGVGNVVLGAHSGGGSPMDSVTPLITTKIQEIWCFDCTYGSVQNIITWAKANPADKLWVYSPSGDSNFQRLRDTKKAEGPDNPMEWHHSDTGDRAHDILAVAKSQPLPNAEVKITHLNNFNQSLTKPVDVSLRKPGTGQTLQGVNPELVWNWDPTYPLEVRHNEHVLPFFTRLVTDSTTLT